MNNIFHFKIPQPSQSRQAQAAEHWTASDEVESLPRCDGAADRSVESFAVSEAMRGCRSEPGSAADPVLLTPDPLALSLIHCLPPRSVPSLSSPFLPTFSFHPRPSFLAVVGVALRSGARRDEHKAKLGQILHAAQIPLEDRGPLSSPPCCSLTLHLTLALCLRSGRLLPPRQLG